MGSIGEVDNHVTTSILGIDLSGPANTADTAVAVFEADSKEARLVREVDGATDAAILAIVAELAEPVVV